MVHDLAMDAAVVELLLGAAAAMSSVINDKEQREKKIAMEAEKKKREKRRLKELNVDKANGGETPEDAEELDTPTSAKALPLRKHQAQASRSMSPAVGRLLNGQHNSISGQLNNRNRSPTAQPQRDSFLNYFFGKDGAWVAIKSNGDRSWNLKNHYSSLAERIKNGVNGETRIQVRHQKISVSSTYS